MGYIGNINGRVTIDIGSIGSWRIAKDNAHKQRYVGNINGTVAIDITGKNRLYNKITGIIAITVFNCCINNLATLGCTKKAGNPSLIDGLHDF